MSNEPSSKAEYEKRYMENVHVDGFGMDVCQHIPCHFCAAPGFMELHPAWGIVKGDTKPNLDEQMRTPATCAECGRSSMGVVERTDSEVSVRMVQLGGPDAPEWVPIKRVDSPDAGPEHHVSL